MTIIEANGISKSFKSGQKVINVLDKVDLNIEKGEMVAIMGVSGSGKSTLLHILGLLNRPDSGNLTFLGNPIDFSNENMLAKIRNKHIGFVFQFYSLIGELTVEENITLPSMIAGLKPNKETIEYTMNLVGLSIDKKSRYPMTLSGGELQRVALARALINNPDIVIADEPTANLDKVSSIDIVNSMENINSQTGQTFIIATHSKDVAMRCHRILYLSGGKLGEKT